MEKDSKQSHKKPSATTASGMDKKDIVEKGIGREANSPGGSENAAGKDKPVKEKSNQIGSQPLPDQALNFGNKE